METTEAVISFATATMMKVAPIVPLIDKSMDLLSKMEGYWEASDDEFDGYVKKMKANLKTLQNVCNEVSDFLTSTIQTQNEEPSDDD